MSNTFANLEPHLIIILQDPVKQLPQQTLSLVKDVQEMKKTLSHLSSLSEDIQEIKQVVKDLQKALADTAAKQDQQATP